MLKKTVKYTNLMDEEVEEDLYFHLSKAEMVELEMSKKDGLSKSLQKIIDSEDGHEIIAEFKKIILHAYGKRSPDGRRFIKSDEIREEFLSSEAYSALFMELVTDAGAAAEWVRGIVPSDLVDEATRVIERGNLAAVPDEPKQVQVVTRAAVQAMTGEELADLGQKISRGEAMIENDTPPAE